MEMSSFWISLLLTALLLSPTTDSLTIHPGCQASCGGVDIPYPFGIGAGCFRPGFEIACVMRTTPVLAATNPVVQVLSLSVMPRPEARVMLPVAYQCYNKTGDATDDYSYGTVNINPSGVYRISNVYNELFVLGCNTFSYTNSGPAGRTKYMFYTGCAAYCNDSRSAQDGACEGIGCCHVDIPPGLTDSWMRFSSAWSHADMEFSPCEYAFIVEKGFYTFQVADLRMNGTQWSMPVRLDWAIRGDSNDSSMPMSCAQAASKPDYTCKSNHSECVDSTNGPGYFCNCTQGYEGNPYLSNGCTNINECERSREEFPCYGQCHDTEGSYDCKCRLGYESNGNPKENPCNPKFPLAAQITLGTVVATSVVVVAMLSVVITFQKRQLFRKNGGNILKNLDSLMFFTEREVKKMTGNYENFLGKGSFGKVYKGTLKDQTTVAVKTYATAVDKDKVNEFVEEVKIQSKMIHKNVLRLKGCCLEVKFPVLIYEYAAEGSLRDIIDRRNRKMVHFPLERRLEIAVGAAEGLAYMHAYTASIIQHGDVKPDNILLDGEFVPKLADFGLSKQLAPGNQYVTHVVGSFGYMDPVLLKKGRQTPANDVYSFGVVLLELITRKAVEHDGSSGECTLVAECRLVCEEENRWREMLDQDITAEDDLPVLEGIFRLAIKCLAEEHRPDMAEVARQLAVLKKDWNDGKKNSQTGHHPEETTADDDAKSTVRSPSASQT